MQSSPDILENEMHRDYPGVLDILLLDRTSKKNIIWCTDSYEHLGAGYQSNDEILLISITGHHGRVIMPRFNKTSFNKRIRSREMAEVFTPSWVCNAQINLIDSKWFGRSDVFNIEKISSDGHRTWTAVEKNVRFPQGRSWQEYVKSVRLEVACGEAPYIVSRYDAATGSYINVNQRIGILDRKLRVVNENARDHDEWIEYARLAYMSTYGYEWQGDSLLLARESMLYTYIDNFRHVHGATPPISELESIASIISWNVWQMDGIKCVIPESCHEVKVNSLFTSGEFSKGAVDCEGCSTGNINKHNGTYCQVVEWGALNPLDGTHDHFVQYVDLVGQAL